MSANIINFFDWIKQKNETIKEKKTNRTDKEKKIAERYNNWTLNHPKKKAAASSKNYTYDDIPF